MKRTPGLALALMVALSAGAAGGQTPIAVLGIEAIDAPLNTADLLALALQSQVRRAPGFKLVAGKDLEEIKLVFGCVDEKPACMARAGRSLNVAKLAWGSLKKSSAGYTLSIKWLDVDTARVERLFTESLPRAELNEAEAGNVIRHLTRGFLGGDTGSIKIATNVPGAEVALGPKALGPTSDRSMLVRDLPAGRHLVRVTKQGYRPWSQQVMVAAGEVTEVDAELQAEEAGETEPGATVGGGAGTTGGKSPRAEPRSGKGWKVAFWSGAVATVGLAVAIGITGAKVLSAESDKETAIRDYRHEMKDNQVFSSDDVCAEASKKGATSVTDACDKGDKYATVTNVLIGTMAAAALVSGYLYYKAYFAKAEGDDRSSAAADRTQAARPSFSPPRVMVSPSVAADGAGLGFQLRF